MKLQLICIFRHVTGITFNCSLNFFACWLLVLDLGSSNNVTLLQAT